MVNLPKGELSWVVGTKIANPDPTRRSSAGKARAATAGSFGLGDAVEVVAKPAARLLGIKDCAPCARRKAALNAAGSRVSARIKALFRSG